MHDPINKSPDELKSEMDAFNDKHFHRGALRRLEDQLPELGQASPGPDSCLACGGPGETEVGEDQYGVFSLVECRSPACARLTFHRESEPSRAEREHERRLYASEKRKHDARFPTFEEWRAGGVARGNAEGQNHD